MISFDQHLAQRVREQEITFEQAVDVCHAVDDLKRLVGRA
jgi:twitching motility protein PilT